MFPFELVISACLLTNPSACILRRIPFDGVNGLPSECAAYAMQILPGLALSLPGRRVRFSCRPSGQVAKV